MKLGDWIEKERTRGQREMQTQRKQNKRDERVGKNEDDQILNNHSKKKSSGKVHKNESRGECDDKNIVKANKKFTKKD
jgi:hypothetical protein